MGVVRGSAGKETHVQEVEDGSHGVGWGAAMSPERSHRVKRRDGGPLFFPSHRAACVGAWQVLALAARISKITRSQESVTAAPSPARTSWPAGEKKPKNPDWLCERNLASMIPEHRLGYDRSIIPLGDSIALVSQRTKVSSCLATSTPMPAWTLSSARASLAALPRPSWRCVREPRVSPVMRKKNSITRCVSGRSRPSSGRSGPIAAPFSRLNRLGDDMCAREPLGGGADPPRGLPRVAPANSSSLCYPRRSEELPLIFHVPPSPRAAGLQEVPRPQALQH